MVRDGGKEDTGFYHIEVKWVERGWCRERVVSCDDKVDIPNSYPYGLRR